MSRDSISISRRRALQTGPGAIAVAAGSRFGIAVPSPRRPNILLLMDGQRRADYLGIFGNRVIKTPNLDRVGREGAVFRQA